MPDVFPQVSVIIPTYRRHREVVRAIRSALAQTRPPAEIVVVNDGPDPEKAALIAALDEPRIRFHQAPRRANASATRNFGVRAATGDWIALLDDDDIWRPRKLEQQFAALAQQSLSEAILAGREQVFLDGGRFYTRPGQKVPPGVPVSELLFVHGGINTSTLMAPRRVFLEHPMDEGQVRHEDWSWSLHAGRQMPVIVADDIVCDRHLAPGTGLSRQGGFACSRAWYEEHRELMTRKSRTAFVCRNLSRKAAYDVKPLALGWLIVELSRIRSTTPRNLVRLLTPWVLPRSVRVKLKFWSPLR